MLIILKYNISHAKVITVTSKVNCGEPKIQALWLNYAAGYYPYGKTLREWNAGEERYLSTQNELDSESGLYYRNARYQDADIARFLGVDALKEKYPSMSSYSYVGGNPVHFIDPSGLSPDEYIIDINTGDREKISNLGGEDVDFIHYGKYEDGGSAFIAYKTVKAEKARPKENLDFLGEKIKMKVNSDIEKYLFERYWLGKGDYHLQVEEFETIVSNAIIEKEYEPIKLNNEQIIIPKLVNLYDSDRYDAAIGRGTLFYNAKGKPIGFIDFYDFDSKPFGKRKYENEMKTRLVKNVSPSSAKPFYIWFGVVPPHYIRAKK